MRIDGRWRASSGHATPFRRHPGIWGWMRSCADFGPDAAAQLVAWPFGDDELRPWVARCLGDLSEEGYVRLLSREDSAVSMVVWGLPKVRVGDENTLDAEHQQRLRSAVASLDYEVQLDLLTRHDASPDDASELVSSLQALEALRRSLPFVLGGLGTLGKGRLLEPTPDIPDPTVEDPDPRNSSMALGREVQMRAHDAEQRIRRAAELMTQVATGVQLARAREDSDQARSFQLMVAILASVAVVPGALAAWFQAARIEVTGTKLAGYMILSALVTAAILVFALRRRRSPTTR
jgi:hypothetical protein